MNLVKSFEAAFVGDSPPQRQTPMPRLPPKHPPPVSGRSNYTTARSSPIRAMGAKHLHADHVNLGIVLSTRALRNEKVRIRTTLTTVVVRDDRVVSGRGRALRGMRVSYVDPFA